jgi:hypothetical protein
LFPSSASTLTIASVGSDQLLGSVLGLLGPIV